MHSKLYYLLVIAVVIFSVVRGDDKSNGPRLKRQRNTESRRRTASLFPVDDEGEVKKNYPCGMDNPCLAPNGLFVNPFDCCSFYNCDRCRAFLQPCGPGTHFNPRYKVCDWPNRAGCFAYNKQCHVKESMRLRKRS